MAAASENFRVHRSGPAGEISPVDVAAVFNSVDLCRRGKSAFYAPESPIDEPLLAWRWVLQSRGCSAVLDHRVVPGLKKEILLQLFTLISILKTLIISILIIGMAYNVPEVKAIGCRLSARKCVSSGGSLAESRRPIAQAAKIVLFCRAGQQKFSL